MKIKESLSGNNIEYKSDGDNISGNFHKII